MVYHGRQDRLCISSNCSVWAYHWFYVSCQQQLLYSRPRWQNVSEMRWNIFPLFPHNKKWISHKTFPLMERLWRNDKSKEGELDTRPPLLLARATSITENYYKCVLHHWIRCHISRTSPDLRPDCWWTGALPWQSRNCGELFLLICLPIALCWLHGRLRSPLLPGKLKYCTVQFTGTKHDRPLSFKFPSVIIFPSVAVDNTICSSIP